MGERRGEESRQRAAVGGDESLVRERALGRLHVEATVAAGEVEPAVGPDAQAVQVVAEQRHVHAVAARELLLLLRAAIAILVELLDELEFLAEGPTEAFAARTFAEG